MNFYKVRYKSFSIAYGPKLRGRFKTEFLNKRSTDGEWRICNVQGNSIKEAIDRIKQDYFDTQLNNWSVWTPAQEQILLCSLPPPSFIVHNITLGGTHWRYLVDKTK